MREGKGFTGDPTAGSESQVAASREGDSPTPLAHDRRVLFKKAGLVAAGAAGVLGSGLTGTAQAAPGGGRGGMNAQTDEANVFTVGPQTIDPGLDPTNTDGSDVGLVVRASSAQSANLIEVQDSSGSTLAHIGPAGGATLSNGLTVLGGADITGTQTVQPGAGDSPGVIVKARANQTANLLEIQDSSGAALLSVDHEGQIIPTPVAPAANCWEVNVLDFGAVGDLDLSDPDIDALIAANTAAMQAALDSLIGTGGGTVCVPAGIYLIGSPGLKWPNVDGVSLVGSGSGASILSFEFGAYVDEAYDLTNPAVGLTVDAGGGEIHGVTLSGLGFRGPGAGDAACYELVSVRANPKIRRVLVDDCTFKWGRHSGLRFVSGISDGITDVAITRSRFEEIGTTVNPQAGGGILASGMRQIRISGCLFSDIGPDSISNHMHAVYLAAQAGLSDVVVTGCNFDGSMNQNTRLTIGHPPGSANISVTGNTFIGQNVNYLHDLRGGAFSGNTLIDSALSVGGEAVTIEGNTFRWTTLAGDVNRSMIKSQTGGAQGVTVTGNAFVNAQAPHVPADYSTAWALYHDNTDDTDWLISGNTFSHIRVWWNVRSHGNVFSNNHVFAPEHTDPESALIHFAQAGEGDAGGVVLMGNVFVTGTDGLVVDDLATAVEKSAIFSGNVFRGGGRMSFAIGDVIPVQGAGVSSVPLSLAALPPAHPLRDGTIIVEDSGAGDRNLIVYAGGQRFRIDGGAAF